MVVSSHEYLGSYAILKAESSTRQKLVGTVKSYTTANLLRRTVFWSAGKQHKIKLGADLRKICPPNKSRTQAGERQNSHTFVFHPHL
jgi:hypothetical protein